MVTRTFICNLSQWVQSILVNICLCQSSLTHVPACDVWRAKLGPVGNSNPILCIFWLERWRGVSFPRWAGDRGRGERRWEEVEEEQEEGRRSRRRVRLQMFTIGVRGRQYNCSLCRWTLLLHLSCRQQYTWADLGKLHSAGHGWTLFQQYSKEQLVTYNYQLSNNFKLENIIGWSIN